MDVTTNQMKILQSACSGKFRDRDERIDAISDLLGFKIESFKELNTIQADDLIRFFNTGKLEGNASWAVFNKSNARHKSVLSRCYTLGWVDSETGYVDLHRLGGWLKSNRSPVQKPLKQMAPPELSKIIAALDGIIKSKYK